MTESILQYLERAAVSHPDKIAFESEDASVTFARLLERARRIGSCIAARFPMRNRAVPVVTTQSPADVAMFLGVVYSGNFYVPIGADWPAERVRVMLAQLEPRLVLTQEETALPTDGTPQLTYAEACAAEADEALLAAIRADFCTTDPLYAIFTSGSTGTPKCVVKSHLSLIGFIDRFAELFSLDETVVFGSQTPFYFDASTKDIYTTLRCAASTFLFDKRVFSFPIELIGQMNRHKVNTVVWVPSVMTLVSNFGVLAEELPTTLRNVFFVGEAMPVKILRDWMQRLPHVRFVNLYGTTEAAGNCLYYEVPAIPAETDALPVGKCFPGSRVLLLDGDAPASEGEVCIVGPTVALGYYGQTDAKKFCRNPLNPMVEERMCRTGDLARLGADGNYYFISRTDFQIKHMGNRIELGDIEAAAMSIGGMQYCCCVYHAPSDRIVLYFVSSTLEKRDVTAALREKLPKYMMPNKTLPLEFMPLNANGKIDRKALLDRLS